MHELSIALSIVDSVEEEAARHEGRVSIIYIRLGLLAGVVKEALLSAFEVAREGASVHGAQLVIEEVPIIAFCERCQTERQIASAQWLCCPICDTPAARIVQGRELELVALEISDGEISDE